MGSDLPGFPLAAASFEAPLEMLLACHDRIRRQCATLSRLRSHLATHGADAAAAEAARNVMRYFDRAARDHHEDEEEDLFPALVEAEAGSDPVCIRQLTESLTADHRELQSLWARVRQWLGAVENGAVAPETADLDAFIELYQRHAAREEEELLPMASRLLGADALDRIGRSMRRRRGITSV